MKARAEAAVSAAGAGRARDQARARRHPRRGVRGAAPAAGARAQRPGDPGAARPWAPCASWPLPGTSHPTTPPTWPMRTGSCARSSIASSWSRRNRRTPFPPAPTLVGASPAVLGFEDDPSRSATARFDDALRRCQRDVRAIHERLFFRPLLEAFAAVGARRAAGPSSRSGMSPAAVAERLAAFGFTDVARTRAAVSGARRRPHARISRSWGSCCRCCSTGCRSARIRTSACSPCATSWCARTCGRFSSPPSASRPRRPAGCAWCSARAARWSSPSSATPSSSPAWPTTTPWPPPRPAPS